MRNAGYSQLSMDGIAAHAGVGKQTLYRWWPSKASVTAEAVVAGLIAAGREIIPDTGDISTDLRTWLHTCVALFVSPEHAPLIRALTAAAADDRGEAQRLYQHFTEPHQAAVVARLRLGINAGQVRPGADLAAAADAFVGALLLQLLTANESVSAERADGLLRLMLPGLLTDWAPHAQ